MLSPLKEYDAASKKQLRRDASHAASNASRRMREQIAVEDEEK